MIRTPLENSFIHINGLTLHVIQAGPEDGQPVILLHGFPEFWYGWRNQIDALTREGFRLYIPDQRGYNLSDKPKEIEAYSLDVLADDIIGLIDHIGLEKAVIVGHDWGGAAAWWTANKFPERLAKLAVLNIPHHAAFSQALREQPAQRRRSWYMAFFGMATLPELIIRRANWWPLRRWAFGGSKAFTDDDIRMYTKAWSEPHAMTSMLNWYRAIQQAPPERLAGPRIAVETLLIWGEKDPVFKKELAQTSIDLCNDGQLIYIEDASHWVQHEAADEVNELLIDFLRI